MYAFTLRGRQKNTVKKTERDRIDIIVLMTEILSGISFYVLPNSAIGKQAGYVIISSDADDRRWDHAQKKNEL